MPSKKNNQLDNLRGGTFPKKQIDTAEIEQTTKQVYNKTRKTSLDLDELTFRQLKYIAMTKSVSMKVLIVPAVEDVVKQNIKLLPNELK